MHRPSHSNDLSPSRECPDLHHQASLHGGNESIGHTLRLTHEILSDFVLTDKGASFDFDMDHRSEAPSN